MASKTFQIIAIIAAVVIVGTVTLAVVATGSDDGGQEGGFFQHLHGLGQYLHGGGDQHDHMAQVIEQLQLTPDQLQRFEKIHAIVANVGGGGDGAMVELHDSLVTQFGASPRATTGPAAKRRCLKNRSGRIRPPRQCLGG